MLSLTSFGDEAFRKKAKSHQTSSLFTITYNFEFMTELVFDIKESGRCLHICPKNLISVAGVELETTKLAEKLLTHKSFFDTIGGGITLSGGEPLLQADFCVELLSILKGQVHTAIETSGYAKSEDFQKVVNLCDFVYMDIKLADGEMHKKYTGVGNKIILENAHYLKQSGIPHTFRTPLIPDITDTDDNLKEIKKLVGESSWEKLPYNTLAGAKYASVGKEYTLTKKFKKEG